MFWLPGEHNAQPDGHAAFRACIKTLHSGECLLSCSASGPFEIFVDGKAIFSASPRFHLQYPEGHQFVVQLEPGRHVFSVHVHHEGVHTRLLETLPAFLWFDAPFALKWKCLRLEGYEAEMRRISPQLGWIEWCDTRLNPHNWQSTEFDDASWPDVQQRGEFEPTISFIEGLSNTPIALESIASGQFMETFGYERDDPPVRFLLRNLMPRRAEAQGVWRRYDLGRVRLGRPRFSLEAPEGARVEIGMCERLDGERVAPVISLSLAPSCNLDRYIARGGAQEFGPLEARGGRFLEIHVSAPPEQVRFEQEVWIDRAYYDEAHCDFECDDERLNLIWRTGIETLRACVEEVPTDNPTRERGCWIGDVTVSLEVAACAYNDLKPMRRALVLAARCAREDGLVAGLCPSGCAHIPTFAALWTTLVWRYYELTDDKFLVEELWPAAFKNALAFAPFLDERGLSEKLGWLFIDWGYKPHPSAQFLAPTLLFLQSLRTLEKWGDVIASPVDSRAEISELRKRCESVTARLWQLVPDNEMPFQDAVLGMRVGFTKPDLLTKIQDFPQHCFPLDITAPRLTDPGATGAFWTPFFAHFMLPLIFESDSEAALELVRKSWGWALEEGLTTWPEQFDLRWSHCHVWSSCPTWLLTRYVLGLHTTSNNAFRLDLQPGKLRFAHGHLPLLGTGENIKIDWCRCGDEIEWRMQTPKPIRLQIGDSTLEVRRELAVRLPR